jgi:cation diffusion facilitator CzcD-associated flavoprotein CzcO
MSHANGNGPHVDIAIVGSGFAGLGMGYRLRQAGIEDFVILERAEGVGGTWWWNTYPGCQCDIPSHLYSFSFAPNPDWTRTYPLQEEIRVYLRRCAEKFGLLPYIRLGHEVERASWNDPACRWQIETSRGTITARVLIGGQGGLSEPRLPDIPGRDSFQGQSFHSARWDDSVGLAGKRVAVLGTGASAIQIVPRIQPKVERLHVFQRTPPWIMPHTDRAIAKLESQLYRRFPSLQRVPRAFAYALRECASPAFTRNIALLTPLEQRARLHLKTQVKDPELREKLTPTYRIGCKRILPSNKWYPAIQLDNVEIVTDGVAAITPSGIRTTAGAELELDVIVYATGFHATDLPIAHRIVGRDGKALNDAWRGSPLAYKNSTVPGYPNLFFVHGLNTGYSSMVFMIESQLNYVVDALRTMRDRGIETVEVNDDAFRSWNDAVQRRMPPTVWNSGGCSSWYIDQNGLSTAVWPDFTWRFRRLTRRFDVGAYKTQPPPRSQTHPKPLARSARDLT